MAQSVKTCRYVPPRVSAAAGFGKASSSQLMISLLCSTLDDAGLFAVDKPGCSLTWLSSIFFEESHTRIFAKEHPGTGNWPLGKAEFRNWVTSQRSALLWCHGKGERQWSMEWPWLPSCLKHLVSLPLWSSSFVAGKVTFLQAS